MSHVPEILIVDDERAAIQVLHNALDGMGDLRYETSGADALRCLETDPIDLVLLDANMPGMDGYATCKALKQEHPEIPVIFVTADHESSDEILALELGASDFLSKPVNPPLVRARVGLHLKLKAQNDLLRELSSHDPLTGLLNRRALDVQVDQEWRRAARQDQPLGLLMADIDHFKAYNDHYGHLQGDACLRQVACTMRATVARAGDVVARYGGEEFAVLLPGSTLEQAIALARKMITAIRALAIPHAYSSVAECVTLSIGATSLRPSIVHDDRVSAPLDALSANAGESGLRLANALFDAADRALYAAKAVGRDRVCSLDAP